MVVIVFNDESKTYQGSRALHQLDLEGSILLHDESIIKKNWDGTVEVVNMVMEGDIPINTLGGTAIGSLIGLLGGPVGLLVGAVAGSTAGAMRDVYLAGVDEDFVNDVSAKLSSGKYALVADISEDWVIPLNTRMEAIGGMICRAPKRDYELERLAADEKAINEDINQLKVEMSTARDDAKAKLKIAVEEQEAKLRKKREEILLRAEQAETEIKAKSQAFKKAFANWESSVNTEIKQLEAKMSKASANEKAKLRATIEEKKAQLSKKREEAKLRAEQAIKEAEAKLKALEKKASEASANGKATIKSGVAKIRERHQQNKEQVKNAEASQGSFFATSEEITAVLQNHIVVENKVVANLASAADNCTNRALKAVLTSMAYDAMRTRELCQAMIYDVSGDYILRPERDKIRKALTAQLDSEKKPIANLKKLQGRLGSYSEILLLEAVTNIEDGRKDVLLEIEDFDALVNRFGRL